MKYQYAVNKQVVNAEYMMYPNQRVTITKKQNKTKQEPCHLEFYIKKIFFTTNCLIKYILIKSKFILMP